MKIALISSGYYPVVDGVTVSLHHRLQWLSQQGHEVRVFCPDYRAIASVYPHWSDHTGDILPGVRVVNLPSEPFMGVEFERNISRQAKARLSQELETFQPDLIHVDEPERIFLTMGEAPGVELAHRDRIPCVAFYHTNFIDYLEDFIPLPPILLAGAQWLSRQIIRRVFNCYDATLVSNNISHQAARRIGIKRVISDRFLGVDVDAFQPTLRQPHFFAIHYGIPDIDHKIKLIFLGRLTPDKGWKFILRVLPHLASSPILESVVILVAGDGELRDVITDTFQDLGIHAHCLGRIPPQDVPALLINSDIHITASEKETLGLTILEAFAAGIPAIAPRAGGVISTITDGETGFLFTPRDFQDWIDKLTPMIQNANLRQAMGDRARQLAAHYRWDHAMERLMQAWQLQIEHNLRSRP